MGFTEPLAKKIMRKPKRLEQLIRKKNKKVKNKF